MEPVQETHRVPALSSQRRTASSSIQLERELGHHAGLADPLKAMTIVSCVIWCRNGGDTGARARSRASMACPWYKRALDGLLPRRQPDAPPPPPARARTPANGKRPALWRSSLKAAASAVARVACLCEPLCSTNVHVDAMVPRRVTARTPTGRSPRATMPAGEWGEAPWTRFRGSTLNEDLLMRRFVLEEEATRRRMVMEVAAKRYGRMWTPPHASRLSLMSLAGEDDNAVEEDAGESGSSSLRCSDL